MYIRLIVNRKLAGLLLLVIFAIHAPSNANEEKSFSVWLEELKSEAEVSAPFCDELARLAEDFDFEDIQKIVLELGPRKK